ncbi:T9SS type A sorting domain-containing protein [Hymenobacter gummosus]|uniref:T9SS type A sorting domain-containing protein n=1 Tax=Hymenobacter gummosus TaxID=1776032 RepID=A0A3S0HLF3_9BACT|nr:GEVED domain-containing protein [Hymenobacter gummosus]RTQ47777.1 T9SS type A sorting domain-containing protein [Hymenobacter gummosus]
MQKTITRLLIGALALLAGIQAARGQTSYVPVVVSGFNADVVASGTAAVNTTTSYDLDGSDGLGYTFTSPDYRNPTAPNTAPTRPLPANGIITNRLNTSMTFQLAGYGGTGATSFNSLRLPATGNNATASGTLTLDAPQPAADVYVLATSGGGASTVTLTLTFTDNTTQSVAAQTVGDWFSGTANIAYQGLGRVSRGNNAIDNASTTTFRLFQLRATISAGNLSKSVERISFNKTSAAGALNVLAVTIVPPCAGTPTAGSTTAGVASACSSTSIALSLSGASTSPGLAYQWQRSTDAGQNWSDINGATAATYSATGQTAETQYRARVTCGASGLSATSTPVTVAQNPFYNCYCAAASTGTNEYINSVAVNTLSSVSNANSGGYADYTSNASLTTSLSQGASYAFALGVRSNAGGSQGGVWIDYDHSGTFDATEYTAIGGSDQIASDVVLTNTLSIPATALLGPTRMRVRWRNSAIAPADACVSGSTSWYGETEEYLVSIASASACAGTPPATTVAASAGSTCAATAFTLTLTGLPAGATGYSIQWQSRPAGTGTFTNLGTASAAPTYTVADQRAATEYRAVVTCTNSTLSTASAPTTVAQNDFLTCYCTPTQGAGCATYATINSVALNTLSSSTGCGGTPYYFLYPASTPANTTTLTIGTSYPLTVNLGRYAKVGVWIDYDHNGKFDAAEYTFIGSNSGNTVGSTASVSQTISIPASALSGDTRLRVRSQYYPTSSTLDGNSSCAGFSYGETEDYTVTLVPELACAGGPPATTATASVGSTCGAAFTLSATGIAAGTTGLSYQWQSSPAGAGSFTNLGAAQTTPGYTVTGQTAATDYRVVLTCANGGQNTTSSVVTVSQSSFLACYCAPTGGSCANEWVRGITLNTLSNTGTTCTSGGYADYSGNSALTTTLTPGTAYSISLAMRFNAANSQVGVWIDYDHSGTFDAAEYTAVGTGPPTNFSNLDASYSATINVPAGALTGPTRLRVRSNNGALNSGQACLNNFSGEVEDYVVTISAPVACTGTPTAGTATASVSRVCAGTGFTLGASGLPSGINGLSYQWESSPAGAGTFAPIGGATTVSYAVAGQSAATDYRLVVSCAASGESASSAPVTVAQTPFTDCYCAPSYASGGTGDIITSVDLWPLSNNTAGEGNPAPYYHDYSTVQTSTSAILVPVLVPGQTSNVTLKFGGDGNQYSGVWVDFNQNAVFEPAEFFSLGSSAGAGGTAVIPVSVPATTPLGPTKMRVRGGNNAAVLDAEACGASTGSANGEAEDYLVRVSATPLPVTLTRFGARRAGAAALLSWHTASETPDMRYEVERSLNGRDFVRLATLAGLGRAAEYSYRDLSPAAGLSYYRLRIVETDNSAAYSPVAILPAAAGSLSLTAAPNPAAAELTVQVDGPAAAGATVQLLDLAGKVLQTGRLDQQRASFRLDKLPAGVYLVRYRDAAHDKTIKVLKQ